MLIDKKNFTSGFYKISLGPTGFCAMWCDLVNLRTQYLLYLGIGSYSYCVVKRPTLIDSQMYHHR